MKEIKKLLQCNIFTDIDIWFDRHYFVENLVLPTNNIDGAFQTASGLYRLNSGDLPGEDFYPYLRIGPILLEGTLQFF